MGEPLNESGVLQFGSYRPKPKLGHHGMSLGVAGYDKRRARSVSAMLIDPFLQPKS